MDHRKLLNFLSVITLVVSAAATFAQDVPGSPLNGLEKLKNFETMRVSSSDANWKNGNSDSRYIEPGGTLTIADLAGPGRIVHFWCTVAQNDPFYSQQADPAHVLGRRRTSERGMSHRRFLRHRARRGPALHVDSDPRHLRRARAQLLLADAVPEVGAHHRDQRKRRALQRFLLLR